MNAEKEKKLNKFKRAQTRMQGKNSKVYDSDDSLRTDDEIEEEDDDTKSEGSKNPKTKEENKKIEKEKAMLQEVIE